MVMADDNPHLTGEEQMDPVRGWSGAARFWE